MSLSPSRRVFMKHGACAMVTLGCAPLYVERVLAAGTPTRRRVLVAVFQRGAVDGLNMVVPHGEPAYYKARPSIAVARPGSNDAVLDLDGFFGLHPRMAPLEPWFTRRALAIVHACGSPEATRSHFDAQDYMETATPGVRSTRNGWLNRYLEARTTDVATPCRGIAIVDRLPRALQGRAPVLTAKHIEQLSVGRTRDMHTAFEQEYRRAADTVLSRPGRDAFDALHLIERSAVRRATPEHGARYPQSAFGEALRQVAGVIKADVGLEVAFAETGNWDHHANEGGATGQLAARLADFALTLDAFATDLGDRLADVVILTMSEFGRTVAENGSRGTDHGHGNAMLVLGGNVKGGRVVTRWPGLEPEHRFEGRDLAVTIDFRDVFAEVLVRHLGLTDAGAVFPGYPVAESRFPGLIA